MNDARYFYWYYFSIPAKAAKTGHARIGKRNCNRPRNRQPPGGFFLRSRTVNVRTDDLRIRDIRELITPEELTARIPA